MNTKKLGLKLGLKVLGAVTAIAALSSLSGCVVYSRPVPVRSVYVAPARAVYVAPVVVHRY